MESTPFFYVKKTRIPGIETSITRSNRLIIKLEYIKIMFLIGHKRHK